jgi:hypothetical protein
VLHNVRHAIPTFGPVHLSKHNIKDGFYRMFLKPSDCPRLAIILPLYEGEEQLIAIPMSSTMGWEQSPPTFCSMSETVADVSNARLRQSPRRAAPHRLEDLAAIQDKVQLNLTPKPQGVEDALASQALNRLYSVYPQDNLPEEELAPPSNRPLSKPVGTTDVFVDDFMQQGQGSHHRLQVLW